MLESRPNFLPPGPGIHELTIQWGPLGAEPPEKTRGLSWGAGVMWVPFQMNQEPPWQGEDSSSHGPGNSHLLTCTLVHKSLPQTFSNSSGLIWAPDCSFELEPDETIVGFADTPVGLSAGASSRHLAGLCRPLGL